MPTRAQEGRVPARGCTAYLILAPDRGLRRFALPLHLDLAIDAPSLGAPTITAAGPTYPPVELAARKVLALFDRAEARDFADAQALSHHFPLDDLVDLAGQLDGGFTRSLLAEALATHRRFSDEELAGVGADPADLRNFADDWRRDVLER